MPAKPKTKFINVNKEVNELSRLVKMIQAKSVSSLSPGDTAKWNYLANKYLTSDNKAAHEAYFKLKKEADIAKEAAKVQKKAEKKIVNTDESTSPLGKIIATAQKLRIEHPNLYGEGVKGGWKEAVSKAGEFYRSNQKI